MSTSPVLGPFWCTTFERFQRGHGRTWALPGPGRARRDSARPSGWPKSNLKRNLGLSDSDRLRFLGPLTWQEMQSLPVGHAHTVSVRRGQVDRWTDRFVQVFGDAGLYCLLETYYTSQIAISFATGRAQERGNVMGAFPSNSGPHFAMSGVSATKYPMGAPRRI